MTKKILVVDDEKSVRYSFQRLLDQPDYQVHVAKNGAEALQKYVQQAYDLVVLDVRLPDISGLEVLRRLKAIDSKAMILIITAFGATETAIEAIQMGAYDYILKPFDIPAMKKLIAEVLNSSHLMRTQVMIEPTEMSDLQADRIVGDSLPMQEVYKMIGRVARTNVNVLVRGESGTGKELVARAIYQHSHRNQKPFLAVNCAAIPETLLESELFGYEKGAFTGAVRRKIGKFEQANEGTLFLDEIGDMTLSTQAKILRVLQEGCYERLGGEQTIRVDVRLIAASNRNLEKAIEDGKFREDLYYRIKVVTITLPPLRTHKEDIPTLITYFLEKHCASLDKAKLSLSPKAIDYMLNYHWPGNIREIENVLKRAIVLSKTNVISENLIIEEFQRQSKVQPGIENITLPLISKNYLEDHRGRLYEEVISQTEKALIIQVLAATKGNQVQASKILGISRVMLRERIEKYKIKPE